ncbi:MAG: hypothetical protein MJZ15_11605 [Bacteroidales bacterium]|nr:hypothetical protein [Bacteroidales bacterium]
MKNKLIKFIGECDYIYTYPTKIFIPDADFDIRYMFEPEDILKIKTAIEELDKEVLEGNGGYKNEHEKRTAHEEVIRDLGIMIDCCHPCPIEPGETVEAHVQYVDLDNRSLVFYFRNLQGKGNFDVDFTEEEAADFLLLCKDNNNLLLSELKMIRPDIYDKIISQCGTDCIDMPNVKWILDDFEKRMK